jgi:hypothetical protein
MIIYKWKFFSLFVNSFNKNFIVDSEDWKIKLFPLYIDRRRPENLKKRESISSPAGKKK